jgi:UDP:flavonoid glycosyltransferase YjiC (YdhE family)
LVPFAQALIDAGHEVRVAAPASFAGTVQRAGLQHAPFDDVTPEKFGPVFASAENLPRLEANAMVIREVFGRLDTGAALPGVREVVNEWRPDLIVREPAEFASYVVADELGLPHVQVAIGIAAFDEFMASAVDEPLREFGCASGGAGLRAAPRLTHVPERVDTEPASGTGRIYRFRAAEPPAKPAPLPAWWPDNDLPLVYVSFGSVTGALPRFGNLYRDTVQALADLRARVLLTVGEASDPDALAPLPSHVHAERWWPQQDVMPYTTAIVGHGGFGTTMLGLTAGVPMVVLPLFSSDQFLNAARVQAVGAGVAIEEGAAAVAELGDAVQRVIDEPSYAAVAREIAHDIAALPPAAAAVPVLEQVARGG